VPERFEREYGCSVSEWIQWLPAAVAPHSLRVDVDQCCARVDLAEEAQPSSIPPQLELVWRTLEMRKIGLLRIARLQVHFRFYATNAETRNRLMRNFDLAMQRGGG